MLWSWRHRLFALGAQGCAVARPQRMSGLIATAVFSVGERLPLDCFAAKRTLLLARCSAVTDPKRKYAGLEHRPGIAAEERMIYCIGMCRLGIRPRRRERIGTRLRRSPPPSHALAWVSF